MGRLVGPQVGLEPVFLILRHLVGHGANGSVEPFHLILVKFAGRILLLVVADSSVHRISQIALEGLFI